MLRRYRRVLVVATILLLIVLLGHAWNGADAYVLAHGIAAVMRWCVIVPDFACERRVYRVRVEKIYHDHPPGYFDPKWKVAYWFIKDRADGFQKGDIPMAGYSLLYFGCAGDTRMYPPPARLSAGIY